MMNKSSRLLVVDYLKGISIMAIVLYHLIRFYSELPDIIKLASNFGGAGVHIFIICSGFGLYYSHLHKPLRFRPFMKKRFQKIYIPYILVVAGSCLTPYMYTNKDKLAALCSHIFLFKMFVPRYESSFGEQLWFVSTIIQFYLVFLALAKGKSRLQNKYFLLLSFGVSLLWWIMTAVIGKADERVWSSFFLQYLWEFALGMVLADQYNKDHDYFSSRSIGTFPLILITVLGVGIYASMALAGGTFRLFNDVFSVFGFGGCILLIYRMKIFNRFFIWINTFSYELFLIHLLVFSTCRYYFGTIPNLLLCGISLLLSVMVGFLYHKLYGYIARVITKWINPGHSPGTENSV